LYPKNGSWLAFLVRCTGLRAVGWSILGEAFCHQNCYAIDREIAVPPDVPERKNNNKRLCFPIGELWLEQRATFVGGLTATLFWSATAAPPPLRGHCPPYMAVGEAIF